MGWQSPPRWTYDRIAPSLTVCRVPGGDLARGSASFAHRPPDPTMTATLSIAVAQINPRVGDLAYNLTRIRAARQAATRLGADLVVYPELCICGYPPEDLVLKPRFQEACRNAVLELAGETADGGAALLVGTPWVESGALYNAALLLDRGRIASVCLKHELPNYGVFDEKRVFTAGPLPAPVEFRNAALGVLICEDLWTPTVPAHLKRAGAGILIVPNGSPFEAGKQPQRMEIAQARWRETGLPIIYANQVGGQDELVFDGASFALNADGSVAVQLAEFQEQTAVTRWERQPGGWRCEPVPHVAAASELERIYRAMVLGLRDYVEKTGFPGVLIGLSGGVDSALSATVAVDALGPERVHCVMMPSVFTSAESLEDAAACASALAVRLDTIPIQPAVEAFERMLRPLFGERPRDVTEENLQSRIRGVTLMALSNKFGAMLLTTGNKSELSVGYATLYGDTNGGYSVLKDVYKMTVYALAGWRNGHLPPGGRGRGGAVIPQRILTKAPTAELRPNQTDQDALPPYEILDGILMRLVEGEQGIDEIVAAGFERDTVKHVEQLLYGAEYKRRQAPPGVKITPKIFGRDRRYPIINRFRDSP